MSPQIFRTCIPVKTTQMTDPTPNDLSHMSDEDFNALCTQGHHAPGAEQLSPAAQAVLNAAINTPWESPFEHDIAAALRAAADHMRHEFPLSTEYTEWDSGHDAGIQRAQNKILAIAAELDTL